MLTFNSRALNVCNLEIYIGYFMNIELFSLITYIAIKIDLR